MECMNEIVRGRSGIGGKSPWRELLSLGRGGVGFLNPPYLFFLFVRCEI